MSLDPIVGYIHPDPVVGYVRAQRVIESVLHLSSVTLR